ncbi:hypothetical protein CDL60_07325 [Roseateles noduli]|nr:hypothetical protein CDL60_07325 [Roseateles noduli]
MVCGDEGAPGPALLKQAAVELGAQVTVLDPARVLEGGAALEEMAGLLGHLYGAIACDGLPPAVMRRLTAAAVVPVLDVQTVQAKHAPVAGRGIEAGERRRLMQAALLAALA